MTTSREQGEDNMNTSMMIDNTIHQNEVHWN